MVQFGWLSHIVFYGAFPDLILFFFKTLGMGCGFRDPIFFFSSVHVFFFLISKKKYIKRTSRKQEANERVQRGTQTKRKHKRKQRADRADKN